MKPQILLILSVFFELNAQKTTIPSCDSPIYCQGDLLHTIQLANIFNDSKTFVDLKLKNNENTTLTNFEEFMKSKNNNPTKDEIKGFVSDNFEDGNELEKWTASDYKNNPLFLTKIKDVEVQQFAQNVIEIWPTLARKMKPEVKDNSELYSFIPIPNGFIIPGGRFKEIYYWDTYWIVKGLLLTEMTNTTKGILGNFVSIVNRFGFIPNGGRVYYLNRSQPPMLSLMAKAYIKATNDLDWLRENINTLEKELNYWLNNRLIDFTYGSNNYTLAQYYSNSPSPRPESYSEDFNTCLKYSTLSSVNKCYVELKSGAETGWDFSSRWNFNESGGTLNTNLSNIETTRVIPVDLNAVLAKAFKSISYFYSLLCDENKERYWMEKHQIWVKTIEKTMYNKHDGIWYDIDAHLGKQRKIYSAGNFAPLWAELYQPEVAKLKGQKAAAYFVSQGLTKYLGGIPTTLDESGEQWDFPNAWPPLQSIVILGLQRSGDHNAQEIAKEFAERWINSNMIGYKNTKFMFEKYDAINPGSSGGGGEYHPQAGFGWTNGAALELINEFYTVKN